MKDSSNAKDITANGASAMLAAGLTSERETCHTKDTPSFVLKNRGAVFYIPFLGWLICLFKGHAKEQTDVCQWKCKRCHATFGIPRWKNPLPPPPIRRNTTSSVALSDQQTLENHQKQYVKFPYILKYHPIPPLLTHLRYV